jgi:hypothetical protein
MNDFVRNDEEKITIRPDGDTSIEMTVPIKDGVVSFNIFYSNSSGEIRGYGKSATERLALSNGNTLLFVEKNFTTGGSDQDSWFFASSTRNHSSYANYSDSGESYLLRAKISTDTNAGRNETDIQKNVKGVWVDVCDDKASGDSCDIGNVTLNILDVSYEAGGEESVLLGLGSRTVFHSIYTPGGLTVYLGFGNTYVSPNWPYFYKSQDIAFSFEDKDGNLGEQIDVRNKEFDLRLTIDDTSDDKLQVSQIDGSGTGGPNGLEIGDSSIYETYILGDVAPRILHYTNPDEDYAEVYYPSGDSESYAEVFLTEVGRWSF